MKFRYKKNKETTVAGFKFVPGEPTEVTNPDIAKRLSDNPYFEAVKAKPKKTSDNGSNK